MLNNEYLGAKIGFHTAANELSKVCPLSVYRSTRLTMPPLRFPRERRNGEALCGPRMVGRNKGIAAISQTQQTQIE